MKEQTTLNGILQGMEMPCTNKECKGVAKYNGYIIRLEKVRFYKCPECGKVTAIRQKNQKVIKKGEHIY